MGARRPLDGAGETIERGRHLGVPLRRRGLIDQRARVGSVSVRARRSAPRPTRTTTMKRSSAPESAADFGYPETLAALIAVHHGGPVDLAAVRARLVHLADQHRAECALSGASSVEAGTCAAMATEMMSV